jgi:hypothetical protein
MPLNRYKWLIGTLLLVLMVMPMLSAEIEYWQTIEDIGNQSVKNHIFYCNYDNLGLENLSSFISGNDYFETYILYNIYPKTFNLANPSFAVDNCNIAIKQITNLNGTSVLLNETYDENSFDVSNGKYFLRMKPQDCATADIICEYVSYANLTHPFLIQPAEMQLVTPTKECKACQYYEWTQTYRSVEKAQYLNAKRTGIMGYIKSLFFLNFEMWLAFFWIFLILMIFVAVGMIFVILWWLYYYIKAVAK